MFERVWSRGGVVLVSLGVLAASVGSTRVAHADEVAVSEAAKRHFESGVALLEDPQNPRYEEAYREFKAAYADSPSAKILGNLGLCAMKLERDEEAVAAYERYLKEVPDLDPGERKQMERDLLTLRTGLSTVTLTSDPPGATFVDVRIPVQGPPITNTYGPTEGPLKLGIRHGHHRITARMPGRIDAEWELEAASGDAGGHTFVLAAPTAAPAAIPTAAPERVTHSRPVPTAVYVGAGLTGVLAIAGTITGIAALNKGNDYGDLNDGLHDAEARSARKSGLTLNVVTDVLLGGALVSAGVTTYLFFARPTVERREAARLRLSPAVSPQGGGFTFGAVF